MDEAQWRAWLRGLGARACGSSRSSGARPRACATRCRSRAPSASPPASAALHRRRRGDRRAPRRAAQRIGAPAREGHRGLRLLHLAGGVPRPADAAPARRLPARLPRRRHRAQAHRPDLRALRAREDAGLPALARRQHRAAKPSARSSARRDPLAKSIEICRDNLRRILDGGYAGQIPLGVNVESVSINRDEIDASVDLFHALQRSAGRR